MKNKILSDNYLKSKFENEMHSSAGDMTPEQLKAWLLSWNNNLDSEERWKRLTKIGISGLIEPTSEDIWQEIESVEFPNMKASNNALYKRCEPTDWWSGITNFFGITHPQTVECIKVSATTDTKGFPTKYALKINSMGGANFCYETTNDWLDNVKIAIATFEIGASAALALGAGILTGGTAALATYCASSIAISVASASALQTIEEKDKWPNGIYQP